MPHRMCELLSKLNPWAFDDTKGAGVHLLVDSTLQPTRSAARSVPAPIIMTSLRVRGELWAIDSEGRPGSAVRRNIRRSADRKGEGLPGVVSGTSELGEILNTRPSLKRTGASLT